MKNFIYDTWAEFKRVVYGKKLYLFGVNGALRIIDSMHKFGDSWDVVAILDNDIHKQGEVSVDGVIYRVCSPEDLFSDNEKKSDFIINGVVLICSTHTKEIASQLESLGIENYYSEMWMDRPDELKQDVVPHNIDDEKIEYVKTLLDDLESARILEKVVEKR